MTKVGLFSFTTKFCPSKYEWKNEKRMMVTLSAKKIPLPSTRSGGRGYCRSDETLCYIRSKIVLKMALQIPKSTTPTVQMAKANFVLPSLWKAGSGWSLLRMYIALTIFR